MKGNQYHDVFYGNTGLFKSVGEDVLIADNSTIKNRELITIGDHVAIDEYVKISTSASIGNYVHIAPSVTILGGKKSTIVMKDFSFIAAGSSIVCGSEDYSTTGLIGPIIPDEYRTTKYTTVIFERFSGTGVNVSVMPGITLGEGSVVGAGSVVTKDTEPWGIYLGVPAKRVGTRPKDKTIQYAKEMGY